MLNFALIGAGRIGKMHAEIINYNPGSRLKFVYDLNKDFAENIANSSNAIAVDRPEEAINSNETDAVLIASATPTHIEFIKMAANASKPVLCEKPIDLDINKVNKCREDLKNINSPIQIGFNRRFDLSHSKVQQARLNKEIGELEMIIISSRDPAAPGLDYLNACGGFFRDTTIHDFDLSRFILGDDPIIQVSAFGENLFDKNVKTVKDFDTAMFILKSASGVLIHINNSRRAVYGYDQRVEVFGSKGMVISNNQTPNSIERYTSSSTSSKEPIHFFFIERYQQAYSDQLNSFIDMIKSNSKPKVTFEDGRRALIIANAAYESYEKKKIVEINYE
ncbi:inositol 2-dehydrogenase [Pelagibacteraceae bacterium]|nr:inositol 2-dehydrogenase [Pelagibacteraceae bacterium]